MGDSRSAIYDDENDWDDLQRRAGISKRVDSNPYSFEAGKAKVGFDKGYTGEVLLAFINKEKQVANLNTQIAELHKKFDQYVELTKSFT